MKKEIMEKRREKILSLSSVNTTIGLAAGILVVLTLLSDNIFSLLFSMDLLHMKKEIMATPKLTKALPTMMRILDVLRTNSFSDGLDLISTFSIFSRISVSNLRTES